MSCHCCDDGTCPDCAADGAIAAMTAQRDELRAALAAILSDDERTPIQDVAAYQNARAVLAKTAPVPCQPDITLSTGRVVRHARMPNGATDASIVGPNPEMTPDEWVEYCRIIAGNPNAGVVQVSPRGRWTP